jgi:hypothetical protein
MHLAVRAALIAPEKPTDYAEELPAVSLASGSPLDAFYCRALLAALAILATATGAISRNRKFVDSPLVIQHPNGTPSKFKLTL